VVPRVGALSADRRTGGPAASSARLGARCCSAEQHLSIQVVPGSGTDELAGTRGELGLTVDDDGVNHYELRFSL
jgi:hypothetical protein